MANLKYIAKKNNFKVIYNSFEDIPERTPETVELFSNHTELSQDSYYLKEADLGVSVLFPDGNRIEFDCQLADLFNEISKCRGEYAAIRRKFDTLVDSGAGLAAYIDTAAMLCGGFGLFVNPRGRVVIASDEAYLALADIIEDDEHLSTEFVDELFGNDAKNKYGQKSNNGLNIYGGRYFDADDELIGIIILASHDKVYNVDTRSICDILMTYMEKRLGPNFSNTTITPKMSALKNCWSRIMDRNLTGNREIRDSFISMRLPLADYVRVGVLHVDNGNARIPYNYINARLHAFFPDAKMTLYHDDIAFIVDENNDGKKTQLPDEQKEKLNLLLEKFSAVLMFSNITCDMSSLRSAFLMVKRTLDVVMHLTIAKDKRLFYYEDYCTYNIFDMAIQRYEEYEGTDDALCLIHPAAIKLSQYDREHKTNLRELIYYYYINDRNILKTSSVVGVNRNTLVQKIELGQKIMDSDLEDATIRQRIIFSCQFLLYYEDVIKGK